MTDPRNKKDAPSEEISWSDIWDRPVPVPPPLPKKATADSEEISTNPARHPAEIDERDILGFSDAPVQTKTLSEDQSSKSEAEVGGLPSPQTNASEDEELTAIVSFQGAPSDKRDAVDTDFHGVPTDELFAPKSVSPLWVKIFAVAFFIVSVGVLLFVVFFMGNSEDTGEELSGWEMPEKGSQAPPRDLEAEYEQLVSYLKEFVAQIGVTQDGNGGDSTGPANLVKLWRLLEGNPKSPVIEAGGTELKELLSAGSGGKPTYEQLWKMSLIVFDLANKQVELVERAAPKDMAADAENRARLLKANLTEWLLGRKGAYCQIRERYWEQEEKQNPALTDSQKEGIEKLGQERQSFLEAAKYPNSPIAEYCVENLISGD